MKLPPIVAAFAAKMPRARLRVVSIDTLFAAGGLAGTEIDVAIGAGEKRPGVHAETLYQEQIVLVARAGHPTIRSRVIRSAARARSGTSRSRSRPGHGNRQLAARYAALGVARNIAVFVPTFTAAAAIVASTDLVASLPGSILNVLGPRLALRRVATPLAPVTTTINLLWHERTAPGSGAARLPRPARPRGGRPAEP